jgi:hypothetical protein
VSAIDPVRAGEEVPVIPLEVGHLRNPPGEFARFPTTLRARRTEFLEVKEGEPGPQAAVALHVLQCRTGELLVEVVTRLEAAAGVRSSTSIGTLRLGEGQVVERDLGVVRG